MQTHYDTTHEQVQIASEQLGMSFPLVHALLERQNTVEDIRNMSPEERLLGYMNWNGLHGWVRDILCVAASAGINLENYK